MDPFRLPEVTALRSGTLLPFPTLGGPNVLPTSSSTPAAPPMSMQPLLSLVQQQEALTLYLLRMLLQLMKNGGSRRTASGDRAISTTPVASSAGGRGNRSAGGEGAGTASEAKQYLLTLPRQSDDPASEFTGLQDSFASPLAGFFRELQEMGVKVTLTAGYEKSGHSPNSLHYSGRAVDFVVPRYSGALAARIQNAARRYGLTVLDEYTRPSAYSTGGHFDVRLS